MKETLCWSCTRPGTGQCSWDREMKPVKGWTAIPSQTDGFATFRVISCPGYEKEPPRKPHEEPTEKTNRYGRSTCGED